MRIGMLALVVIAGSLLSGCAMFKHPSLPAPCGVEDYLELQPGTVITGVSLPTDEAGKKYNIITKKQGMFLSMDCDERLGR